MIDLPDHGYTSFVRQWVDAGGVVTGELGGPDDIIDRPGLRFAITYSLPFLAASKEARIFESRLARAKREDASYPWPLDMRPPVAGSPKVNGSSPAGATIPLKGLIPGYPFYEGQPVSVISGGLRYVHIITDPTGADGAGHALIGVFPFTRTTFSDNDVVEIEHPRIAGIASYESVQQGPYGRRPFTFTISERR